MNIFYGVVFWIVRLRFIDIKIGSFPTWYVALHYIVHGTINITLPFIAGEDTERSPLYFKDKNQVIW